VYEGEVTELAPEEAQSQTGGYGKVISHVVIGLKTVKGTKQLKLDPTIYDRCSPTTFSWKLKKDHYQTSWLEHQSGIGTPNLLRSCCLLLLCTAEQLAHACVVPARACVQGEEESGQMIGDSRL
jgi:hypothetical protein